MVTQLAENSKGIESPAGWPPPNHESTLSLEKKSPGFPRLGAGGSSSDSVSLTSEDGVKLV